jgi:hypothetical protein
LRATARTGKGRCVCRFAFFVMVALSPMRWECLLRYPSRSWHFLHT